LGAGVFEDRRSEELAQQVRVQTLARGRA
jgi:hypothetical protein